MLRHWGGGVTLGICFLGRGKILRYSGILPPLRAGCFFFFVRKTESMANRTIPMELIKYIEIFNRLKPSSSLLKLTYKISNIV
jgi:hypothetical protein